MNGHKNVFGEKLMGCCSDPMTGFYRDGYCRTSPSDVGTHVVCAIMTREFLEYTQSKGNDLSTPMPQFNFPGLNPGDKWCLCVTRWLEAEKAGCAPYVDLSATDQRALEYTDINVLKTYAE